MNVFDLVAKLTLDTKDYDKGLDSAEKNAGSFADKFKSGLGTAAKVGAAAIGAVGTGVAVATKAFISGAGEAAAYGDTIDKNSQKMGLSAKAYQEWDYVLNLAGTEMSSMSTGLKTLTNKIDDAKTGSSKAQEMFGKLGISMEDLGKMSREDIFEATIYGFQKMEDSTERAALANDLFGKSGQALAPIFNQTTEETKRLLQEVNDLGGVMSDEAVKGAADYQDSLTRLHTSMEGLKNNMFSNFLPAMSEVANGLAQIFAGDSTGIQAVDQGIDKIVQIIADGAPKVLEVGSKLIMSLAEAILNNLPKIVEAATKVMLEIVQELIAHLPEVVKAGIEIIGTLAQGIGEALPELIPAAVDAVITVVETLIDNADKLIDGAFALIEGLFEGLIRGIPRLIQAIPEIIVKLITAIISNAPRFVECAINLVIALATGLIEGIPELLGAIPRVIQAILDGFAEVPARMLEIGQRIVEGIWNGITSFAGWIRDKVTGFFSGIVDGVKSFLGIKSPSKVFAKIGGFMSEGLGEGWEENFGDVKKAIENDMTFDPKDVNLGNMTYGVTAMNNGSAVTAMASRNNDVTTLLKSMLDKLDNMNMDQQIVLDTGVLVGQTVNKMDTALGNLANRNARRVFA